MNHPRQSIPASNATNLDTTHQEPMTAKMTALWNNVARPAGYILALSYPALALSASVRALYQLFFKAGVTDYLPSVMSGVAALCYLLATIGFIYRKRWSWWLSVVTLGVETLLTLVIGIWSYIDPALIGSTVWRHFGADYGYFPLFQPILGLLWLFWPLTMQVYGIKQPPTDSTT